MSGLCPCGRPEGHHYGSGSRCTERCECLLWPSPAQFRVGDRVQAGVDEATIIPDGSALVRIGEYRVRYDDGQELILRASVLRPATQPSSRAS